MFDLYSEFFFPPLNGRRKRGKTVQFSYLPIFYTKLLLEVLLKLTILVDAYWMLMLFPTFSGMLVQDPTKGNDVDSLFNQARQMGAVEGPIDHARSSSSSSFTGTGRLLTGATVHSAPDQPESIVHNIVFWSNGFTVNDGPLRRLDDPENASFLEVSGI